MKKGEGENKHSRRITMSVTASTSPNESSWGWRGGCLLGFLIYLFSAGTGTYGTAMYAFGWISMRTCRLRFCPVYTFNGSREYELITEAHAQLSVVENFSRFSLSGCSGGGETAGGQGVVSTSMGWGRQTVQYTQGYSIWSKFRTTECSVWLLLKVHILLTGSSMWRIGAVSPPPPADASLSQMEKEIIVQIM
jgi:hypothetical protein